MSRPEPIATLDSALAAFQAEAADAERRVMNFENAHADTLRELRDLQHEHSDAVRKAAATRNAIQNLGYLPVGVNA